MTLTDGSGQQANLLSGHTKETPSTLMWRSYLERCLCQTINLLGDGLNTGGYQFKLPSQ